MAMRGVKARWQHIRHIARWWWALVAGTWSLFWVVDASIGKWGSPKLKATWDIYTLHVPADWRYWLIGILLLSLFLIVEGSYRWHKTTVAEGKKELEDRLGELAQEINSLTLELEREKDRNRPKLSGVVFDLFSAPLKNVSGVRPEFVGKYATYMVLRAAVGNNGTPSIAKAWRLEVETANGKKETAQKTTLALDSTTLRQGEVIFGADALDEKTYPQPIPNGAEIPGALAFLLASISTNELPSRWI
ncbi:MAG TPA: hypothetical protein VGQ12_18840 [Candidatus Angelobacter sp.]|jgi:hypothetical protein|nr:hypothetical protein [Candidatus Angelobacter sp.]